MNNLTFNNGAYKLEKANGEVYEGVVSNLVAHFLTDTITITDRVTLVKLPIITAQSNDLQIGGQTKTFEQIKTIIETELAKGGGASTADAVSYDNTTSGLQSTNVQDALDEVGANLGGFKLIKVSIVPTDTTFTNFAVLDQSQIQSIIQARENNEKFIVVIEMTTGSSTKQNYIGYFQGDSGDKQYFEVLLESDFGEILGQYGLKMSFKMFIRYEDASVTFEASPTQMVLTYDQYQQIESQGGIKHNCTYLIK